MVLYKILLFCLCLITIISAIAETIYVKYTYEHHIRTTKDDKLEIKRNRIHWIKLIFLWILSIYFAAELYQKFDKEPI